MKTILNKFQAGMIFSYPTGNPTIGVAPAPNGFRTVVDLPSHLGHSVGKFGVSDRVSSLTAAGPSGDSHRNLRWLPYIPGFVSEVQQQNLPVITGPLSGCPTTRYLRGGEYYVGHPGTVDDHNHADSIAARNFWNAFAATLPPHSRTGCNVLADLLAMGVVANRAPMKTGDGGPKCFAIVMPNGDFYGMMAYPQSDNVGRKRPMPVPASVVGNDAWWRVCLAPVRIQNTVFPANGLMV